MILEEALRIVHGSRQTDYGHPIENWSLTAELVTTTLRGLGKLRDGAEITAEDLVLCMLQVKIAREIHRPKEDNAVDLAGYAEVLAMIRAERQRRTEA